MIQRKKGRCKNPDCSYEGYLYSKGLCQACYWASRRTIKESEGKLSSIRRNAPIRPVSDRERHVIKAKMEIKRHLIEINGKRCFFCGHTFHDIQLVHLLRQGTEPMMKDKDYNCILGCQSCHDTFDNASLEEVRKLGNIDWVLEMMQAIDEKYYERFVNRKLKWSVMTNS